MCRAGKRKMEDSDWNTEYFASGYSLSVLRAHLVSDFQLAGKKLFTRNFLKLPQQ